MLFARVGKQGKYRDSWTPRRIAFDTETGHLYCTEKLEGNDAHWKHKVKVLRIIAKATVTDFDFRAPDFDSRELFSFRVEGSYCPVGNGIPAPYTEPIGPDAKRTFIQQAPPHAAPPKEAEKISVDFSKDVIVWYFRSAKQEDFMKIYTTIRDILILERMRPPQFWGLPKMDPRIEVPLAEPPLYLWYRFRAVKHKVFYACVHGYMALHASDANNTITFSRERMYLTVFDSVLMVFRENGFVFAGIPTNEIGALHYASTDISASISDPTNTTRACFLSFLSNSKEYSDILFLPTLETFAEPTAENVPAAQVNRVEHAVRRLSPLMQKLEERAGRGDAAPIALSDARNVTDGAAEETANNDLLNIYAREAAKQRGGGLRLQEAAAFDENKDKERSEFLVNQLPPPHRLSTLASELGIKMKKTVVSQSTGVEYVASDATVCPSKSKELAFQRDGFHVFHGVY